MVDFQKSHTAQSTWLIFKNLWRIIERGEFDRKAIYLFMVLNFLRVGEKTKIVQSHVFFLEMVYSRLLF